jgi:hypothetical protein
VPERLGRRGFPWCPSAVTSSHSCPSAPWRARAPSRCQPPDLVQLIWHPLRVAAYAMPGAPGRAGRTWVNASLGTWDRGGLSATARLIKGLHPEFTQRRCLEQSRQGVRRLPSRVNHVHNRSRPNEGTNFKAATVRGDAERKRPVQECATLPSRWAAGEAGLAPAAKLGYDQTHPVVEVTM